MAAGQMSENSPGDLKAIRRRVRRDLALTIAEASSVIGWDGVLLACIESTRVMRAEWTKMVFEVAMENHAALNGIQDTGRTEDGGEARVMG